MEETGRGKTIIYTAPLYERNEREKGRVAREGPARAKHGQGRILTKRMPAAVNIADAILTLQEPPSQDDTKEA